MKPFPRNNNPNILVRFPLQTTATPASIKLVPEMRRTTPIASSSASAALFAALPKCPLCLVALLAPLGIRVSGTGSFLVYVAAMVLAIPLVLFWVPACRRCGVRPLLLALLGACVMMVGRFAIDSLVLTVTGAAILFASALWTSRLPATCPKESIPSPHQS